MTEENDMTEAKQLFNQEFSALYLSHLVQQDHRYHELLWLGFSTAYRVLVERMDQMLERMEAAMGEEVKTTVGDTAAIAEALAGVDMSPIEQRADQVAHAIVHMLAAAALRGVEITDDNVIEYVLANTGATTREQAAAGLVRAGLAERFPKACGQRQGVGGSPDDSYRDERVPSIDHEGYCND